jgi:endoglucanase
MLRIVFIVGLLLLLVIPVAAQPLEVNRCINLGNTLEAPVEGEWGFVIAERDLQVIAEAGFDTVRIPIRWSAHTAESAPYTVDAAFFERIDEVVNWALDAGLQAIINIHHYDALIADPDGQRDRFEALWQQIATRYQDYPPALIFEILNEPHTQMTASRWNRFQNNAVDLIREIDPDRTLILGPVQWNSLWQLPAMRLPDDTENIIVTFHNYEPFEFTHQGAEWVAGANAWLGTTWGAVTDQWQLENYFEAAADWRAKNNVPLLMGEFGAYRRADQEARLKWTRAVVEQAEANDIGWCYWEFAAGFGIYDRGSQQFNDVYRALIPETE